MGEFNSYTPNANSIDPINDLLLIYQSSSGTLRNINRNTYNGISSQPLGLTDTQSPTNKTFGITNTITILDTLFTIQDNGDNTKQLQLQLSGITTGTVRTLTIPNISSTIATIGGSQSFSGVNSFTGSSWTGGTISNTAIASDTITGFTSSTSGNIYGIAVTSGVITGANTVGNTALITNAVQGNQLATNAITLGYTQITTNFSTTSTSAVQVTGLTVTVTIPAGGRRVKITVGADSMLNTGSGAGAIASIYNGTVGSGTLLTTSTFSTAAASQQSPLIMIFSHVPAAGSITYNVGFRATANTATIEATTTNPAFVLVEVI